MQLCEAVESHLRQSLLARPPVQRTVDNSIQMQIQEEQESIWHYLERDEVRALGLIVERWSKGRLDGLTARAQFQSQVLRGQSQQAVEFQNAGSAFLRAGLDGALAGISLGNLVSPGADVRIRQGGQPTGRPLTVESQDHYHIFPNAQSQGIHISPVMPPGLANLARFGDRGPPGATMPGGPLGGMPGASSTTINIGPQGVLGSLAGHLFEGLAAGVMGGARASARTQTVFTAIDTIFLHSRWEDTFQIAMQELGLDGPRPLPGEVRVSFQQKAKVIIQTAARQHAVYESWLDLVLLCLCVEVIRRTPTQASNIAGGSTEVVPPVTASSASTSAPSQAPRLNPRTHSPFTSWQLPLGGSITVNDVTVNSANDVTLQRHFVMGPGGTPGDMHMIFGLEQNGSRSGGAPGADAASYRLDRDFLRDRVFVLMDALLGGPGGPLEAPGRPAGLTAEEMNLHCPVAIRSSVNGDSDSCPICLEPCVTGEPIRQLPCKHELHQQCCEAWLATADTCPTCRHQIPRSPRT